MGVEVFESAMLSMGLTPRPQQTKLVGLIRSVINTGGVKFVQAGTGVGKSYALLTTALEAARTTGMPSVVICPNNSLINQYVSKDAPRIKKSAGGDFAYVKGRSRYLCAQSKAMQDAYGDRAARQRYVDMTSGGKLEWSDHAGIDYTWGCPGAGDCDSNNAWASSPNCPFHSVGHRDSCDSVEGKPWKCECRRTKDGHPPVCSCQFYCGAFEAKRRAMSADVVITNAHVLVWDYLVRQFTGDQAQLLPDRGALFVDECHEVEAIGRSCQSYEIKPGSKVYDVLLELRPWVDRVTMEMVNANQSEGMLGRDPEIVEMAKHAATEVEDLLMRADVAGTDVDMAKHYRKEAKLLQRFVDFVAEDDQHISTVEVPPYGRYDQPAAVLRRICVDTSWLFRDILTAQPSVLVSGTIPASGPKRLGVSDFAKIDDVGHPFDYSKSRLVISNHRGNDRDSAYARSTQTARAINATGGGALILFTSWADLENAMPMVVSQLNPEIAAEVYVQSKDDPASLKTDIEDFRDHGNAVLAGVRSLWTGLDIPGRALRTVIIWKLPYGVPTLEAKAIEKAHGRDVYWDSMLTTLTQGIGRLIRSTDDAGTVFIADSRARQQQWRRNGMTKHIAEFGS